MPRVTSGRPISLPLTSSATRWWQASAISCGRVRWTPGTRTPFAERPEEVLPWIELAHERGFAVAGHDLAGRDAHASVEAHVQLVMRAEAEAAVVVVELLRADAQVHEDAVAQIDGIRASIRKKTIRAPFAGSLGIRLVNLGQILNEGEPIVSLQTIDPIFVNFSLPQQQLAQVKPGLKVRVTTDGLPGQVIEGEVTAISPEVDVATRNIRIQATVAALSAHSYGKMGKCLI